MAPKDRKKQNKGLPERWRVVNGTYYYMPREAERPFFDNVKFEKSLGNHLGRALEEWGRRMARFHSPEGTRTMEQLCDLYMAKAFPQKKPQSRGDIPRYVARLREGLGSSPIEAITTQHVYQMYEALKEARGHNTANKQLEVLSDMLSHAIRWGLLETHPMTGGKFKKTRPEKKFRYIEDWELEAALEVAPPLIAAYIELKWLTGLRRTDLLSMTWNQVREDGIHVESSKTAAGQIFEWDENLHNAIVMCKNCQPRIGSIYVFATRTGQSYINEQKKANGFESMWGRWMKKALATTRLEKRFSERQIRNKVSDDSESLEEASRRLGHSSLSTTKKHYRSRPEKVTPLTRNRGGKL